MTGFVPARVPLDELLAAAARHPHAEALRHKRRGVWLSWSWLGFLSRSEQLAQALRERHPRPALFAVSGEYAPSLLLFALAAARFGAGVVPLPTSLPPSALAEFLAGARPDLVFLGLREQLGTWRTALSQSGHAPEIVADVRLPWGRTTAEGVRTAAELLGPPPAARPASPSGDIVWIEESTDWTEGLSHILHAAAHTGRALAFPESRAAATRDRRELQPTAFALSAAHHARVQRDLAARLPGASGIAAHLTRAALAAAEHGRPSVHHRWLLARLRRPLGLGRLRELTVVPVPADADSDLFATLGIPAVRAPAAPPVEQRQLAFA